MKNLLLVLAMLIAFALIGSAMAEGLEIEYELEQGILAQQVEASDGAEADVVFSEPLDEIVAEEEVFSFGEDGSDTTVEPIYQETDTHETEPDQAVMAGEGGAEFEIVNGILVKYNGEGGDVVIPDGVTVIGEKAFYVCDDLTGVIIPNSVTSIEDYAFWDCAGLTSVSIPNSVTKIGDLAFAYCERLSELVIPDSVTSIGGQAFSGCSGLTSVTIPNSVTNIGYCAFKNCSGLTRINIPTNIETIEYGTFADCTGLKNISIPNSVTLIGVEAFLGCSGLINLTFGDKVFQISSEAFRGCRLLESISLPASIGNIDSRAFGNCYRLTNVTIDSPKNTRTSGISGIDETGYHYYEPQIISIADDAFTGCPTSLVFHTRCETAATKWAGGKGFMVVKSEHEFETLPGKEATCTETGLTEGKKCVYCLEVTQEVIAAKGHTEVVDPAVSPTCTETGLTEGSHCSVCNAILTAQETIPAKGHTAITDPAFPATYTKTGLTEGSHCSVCGEVLIAQKTLPVLKPISIAKATITVKAKAWTGKALKPKVTVKLNGKTLKKGTDYTVSYKNNTDIGKATVTVKGKGKYTGTAKGSFVINPKKVSGLKLKAGEKQLTATWKKAAGGVTGYQIEYGLTKDFKGAKQVKVKKAATVKKVLQKLKTGKAYYVRIRAYKKVGKKTYWSDWSKAVKSKKAK